MKVIGDWYIHHEGDKHETHIGNTYIKQTGETIIENIGNVVIDTSGDVIEKIDGSVIQNITLDHTKLIGGDYRKEIQKNHNVTIGGNFINFIAGFSDWKINDNESKEIHGDFSVNIMGNSIYNIVKSWKSIVGEKYTLNTNDHIIFDTLSGNINLTTQGKFEIADAEGNITGVGYKNLGTRGNISLKSTFGNIGLFTVENKDHIDL
jgi:hypothetical protein